MNVLSMQCDELSHLLPALGSGRETAPPHVVAHVETCLRCQADVVQYRKLLRALHNMRTEVLEPSPGLLTDIFAHLEAAGERRAIRSMLTGRRVAYIGGIAAATAAAGAAGAIVLARRGTLRRAS
jgi:hypothetical protein